MQRRVLDIILTSVGLLLTVVLFVAGGLLTWAHNFANSSVHDQLAEQKIFVPPKGSPALAPAAIGPYLNRYAGQELLSGPQAKAYADHFIAVHLGEVAGGQTYAQVSAKAQADPTNATLQKQAQTLFQGQTLRGLLLEAYAFWELGHIALIAAIVSFVLGAVMLILTLLGVVHLLRVPGEVQAFRRRAPIGRATA